VFTSHTVAHPDDNISLHEAVGIRVQMRALA